MLTIKSFKLSTPLFKALAILTLALLGTTQAFALPSFARQTGDACDSCHVGAFGPQLTPHGIKFKLGGYTDSDGKPGHIPLAAMLIDNYTHTNSDQDHEDFKSNNNNVVQELSGFLAGKLADHVGSFMQVTYSDVDKATALDNTEFRYATEATLFGQPGVYGLTINNNPSMQDPFNTMPAWRFPYNSADLADAPETAPLLDDGVAGTVYGLTAYTQMNNGVYAELGFYKSFSKGFLEQVNVEPGEKIDNLAPYWRVAYFKDMHEKVYSVGLVGMSAKLQEYGTSGPNNKFNDIGLDAHYQYLGTRKHIISVDGSYIDESRDLVGEQKATLHQLNVAGSYYYDKSYGGTVRYFNTTGNKDTVPDSDGWMLQADWTPFGKEDSWNAPLANLRVGLQYTLYNKFEGDSSNASDYNTLMAFLWLSM